METPVWIEVYASISRPSFSFVSRILEKLLGWEC
jgi:hypothetical protein